MEKNSIPKWFIVTILFIISLFIFAKLSIDNHTKNKNKHLIGTFVDSRDNQNYKWVILRDSQIWMGQNLNYHTENSWCYSISENHCKNYGRLYTWSDALVICPKGWHLPSKNDWENIIKLYGGEYNAYKELMGDWSLNEGSPKFQALSGGTRAHTGNHYGLGQTGGYWSTTEGGEDWVDNPWYFAILKPNPHMREKSRVYMDVNYFLNGFSCRCIKD